MKLTLIRKTALSNETNCPALYRTDDGDFVVVGRRVTDPALLAQATAGVGPDEVAVLVSRDVLHAEALEAAWRTATAGLRRR